VDTEIVKHAATAVREENSKQMHMSCISLLFHQKEDINNLHSKVKINGLCK
jgi:hypothetical protein